MPSENQTKVRLGKILWKASGWVRHKLKWTKVKLFRSDNINKSSNQSSWFMCHDGCSERRTGSLYIVCSLPTGLIFVLTRLWWLKKNLHRRQPGVTARASRAVRERQYRANAKKSGYANHTPETRYTRATGNARVCLCPFAARVR